MPAPPPDKPTNAARPWLLPVAVGLTLAACAPVEAPTELFEGDVEDIPLGAWPDVTPCAPQFSLPPLPAPTGDFDVYVAAPSFSVGSLERIIVRWPEGDGAPVDGPIAISTSSPGLVVVDQAPMVDGAAGVTLRADAAFGEATVTISHAASGRSVSVPVRSHASALPVWSITVAPADLAHALTEVDVRPFVPCALEVDGVPYDCRMRLHGGSSRFFPKKSWRIEVDPAGPQLDGHRKHVLRAEWNDKSMARTALGYRVFGAISGLPTPDTEAVHLRINGAFYGVMNHVERIEDDFFRERGLDPRGSMYEADPPIYFSTRANLDVLDNPSEYTIAYQQQLGDGDFADLRALIEDVLQEEDPEALRRKLGETVRGDDVLLFLAVNAVIQNRDFVRKNYFIYREEHAVDRRWRMIPWDVDLSFGLQWTPENDVLDENIFIDGDPWTGTRAFSTVFYNQLVDKLLSLPEARERYLALLDRVADVALDPDAVSAQLDARYCAMGIELLTDPNKRASNAELPQRRQEVVDFVTARKAWLKTWIAEQQAP